MKLPEHFWLRLLNGAQQKTWTAQKSEERGFCIINDPGEGDKKKIRVKPKPGAKLVRRAEGGYHLQVLIGKEELQGDIFWTPPVDQTIGGAPVELIAVKRGHNPSGEEMIQLTLNYDYNQGSSCIMKPHVAERLYKQLHQLLHPEVD